MRDLIVSVVAVALLIGAWLLFFNYSQHQINQFAGIIETSAIPLAGEADWDGCNTQISILNRKWHKYKSIAFFFLDTDSLNQIDYSMARSVQYIKAQDYSNASGELLALSEQLKRLYSNERITFANIL